MLSLETLVREDSYFSSVMQYVIEKVADHIYLLHMLPYMNTVCTHIYIYTYLYTNCIIYIY